ncbi:MAG TPA: hypothetical protein VFL91_08490 [Thermomicrobiales bacterium]|nr:hypothetical protein [Thermomicrobiales bacterium]
MAIHYSDVDPRLWPAAEHWQTPRRFGLYRNVDPSGVSGTGVVAVGCEFLRGKCVLCWVAPPYHGIEVRDSIEEVVAIHGHQGATEVLWFDKE